MMVEEGQGGSPLEVGGQGMNLHIHYDDIQEEVLDVPAYSADDHSDYSFHYSAVDLDEAGEASDDSGVDEEPESDDHEEPQDSHCNLGIDEVDG
mmetsp:Transcript_27183/g.59847  ORF Transcript_27183/g.59847 Transcript_27183/m.59847 type:complete len:94 (+) Transcript_27183:2511-2792(+)